VIRPFSDPPRIYGGQRLVATLEDSLKNGAGNGEKLQLSFKAFSGIFQAAASGGSAEPTTGMDDYDFSAEIMERS